MRLCAFLGGCLLLVRRGDCALSGLEADATVRAVAKRLVDGSSATAKREGSLAGQIVGLAVRIDEFNAAFGSFHAKRAVVADGDLHLRHSSSGKMRQGPRVSL